TPHYTLFPYTTLFRSDQHAWRLGETGEGRADVATQRCVELLGHRSSNVVGLEDAVDVGHAPNLPIGTALGPATDPEQVTDEPRRSEEHTSELQSRENL